MVDRTNPRRRAAGVLAAVALTWTGARSASAGPADWPPVTDLQRPWAFNWWMGSAVDRENLSRELQRYQDGDLGGVSIVPIYGAKGAESRYVPFLSPRWMDLLGFTVGRARELGMDVDMTTGTGWCFGGSNVPPDDAGRHVAMRVTDVTADGSVAGTFDPARVQILVAVDADGVHHDLKPILDPAGHVKWTAGPGGAKVYALTDRIDGPKVKRAAPGSEGPMINPLSPGAMDRYLGAFTRAFAGYHGPLPRAMFHDSYEYGSNFSPEFPAAFAARRGYRLDDRIEQFTTGPTTTDAAARVRCDYDETVSDLMIDDVFPRWMAWCHGRGMATRYQAHGSPANLLDLYALADEPETEMFGRASRDPLASGFDGRFGEGDRSPLISKFASSAAHVVGRPLTSAETGTWMAEHFCETLEEMKCLADLMFVSGINHVVYHGCCYSPDDAPWPGWVFYASTEMNPRNPIWHDVPALNRYVARCQSILQSGTPSNDVLLYWPVHELWTTTPRLAPGLTVHDHSWLMDHPIGVTATTLWNRGYGFDYVSDRQLATATVDGTGGIHLPGGRYPVVLVPPTNIIPLPTLRKLIGLAAAGGTVLFQDSLPTDVPGAADLATRRAALHETTAAIAFSPAGHGVRRATVGKGHVWVGALEPTLAAAGVLREPVADHPGVHLIRRTRDGGYHYFIANQGTTVLDDAVVLGTPAASVVAMDPMTGRTGELTTTHDAAGRATVHLHLDPGQSIVLRTFRDPIPPVEPFPVDAPGAVVAKITGPWKVRFLSGGPTLPKPFETQSLASWTANGDPATAAFGGTALYTTAFDIPAGTGPWLLDLGQVCHSAQVRINGGEPRTLLMHPYRLVIDHLRPHGNALDVEVTNLAANRIRDLDRRHVDWKTFHDTSVVTLNYKPFDASAWPVFDSGLLGPVVIRSVADDPH